LGVLLVHEALESRKKRRKAGPPADCYKLDTTTGFGDLQLTNLLIDERGVNELWLKQDDT
jgi:hypothetical protein